MTPPAKANVKKHIPQFTDHQKNQIRVFFELYDRHYIELSNYLKEQLGAHPELAPIFQMQTDEQRLERGKFGLKLLRAAVKDQVWEPYLEHLQMLGLMYAKMGLSYPSWLVIINVFGIFMHDKMFSQIEDRTELRDAIEGKWIFSNLALEVIGETYLIQKIEIIEHQRQAQEKLNKELESFAYVVSHDLKAPLRGISQLVEFIREDCHDLLPQEHRDNLSLVQSRVSRLNSLINGILEYSRAGRTTEEATAVDLKKLVRDVTTLLNVPDSVQVTVQENLPAIYFNKVSLEQIFANLISNAIKYNDKDKVKIDIGCTDTGEKWECFVKDNGPGIEEKYHDRIFTIFQTLAPRDEVESTGIGLTIVKKILEERGEKVWLESSPGKGAKFIFTLSKQPEPESSPAANASAHG